VRYFALFEGETPVASVAGAPMTQQVRGALYSMGGIWGVATQLAARRKGYSRRLLTRLLAALREDGRSLSCLYPFRESFYERLGYVTFPQPRTAKFAPSALAPLLKRDLGGEVELTLIGDGLDTYLAYVGEMQGRVHGMAMFDFPDRVGAQSNRSWLALAKVDGELVGLMVYNLRGEEVMKFNLRASRFYYRTSQGRYLLLAWIARHVDQASQVEIRLPPYELPETWLADLKVVTEPSWIPPMGRVLDVARIGGMDTGPGDFTARVSDPLCPWNEGVWRFETVDGKLQVISMEAPLASEDAHSALPDARSALPDARSALPDAHSALAGEADCDLSVQALAALIYGTHDPGDFAIRGWGNPSPEVQEIMRAMFPPRLPYLHEYF
jgi:hypothetical protein